MGRSGATSASRPPKSCVSKLQPLLRGKGLRWRPEDQELPESEFQALTGAELGLRIRHRSGNQWGWRGRRRREEFGGDLICHRRPVVVAHGGGEDNDVFPVSLPRAQEEEVNPRREKKMEEL